MVLQYAVISTVYGTSKALMAVLGCTAKHRFYYCISFLVNNLHSDFYRRHFTLYLAFYFLSEFAVSALCYN